MAEQELPKLTEQQKAEWVRDQFQRANKFLAENGVLFDAVVAEESRYLVPFVAVWKISSMDTKQYWVISGDLPTDYMNAQNAQNVREALRHFAMKWQLKAENIRSTGTQDKTQLQFAAMLEMRAENLFDMQNEEALWNQSA